MHLPRTPMRLSLGAVDIRILGIEKRCKVGEPLLVPPDRHAPLDRADDIEQGVPTGAGSRDMRATQPLRGVHGEPVAVINVDHQVHDGLARDPSFKTMAKRADVPMVLRGPAIVIPADAGHTV